MRSVHRAVLEAVLERAEGDGMCDKGGGMDGTKGPGLFVPLSARDKKTRPLCPVHAAPLVTQLLDIGCGDGYFTRALAASLPRASITAVDTAKSKRFVGAGSITFVKGRAEELPLESESFDVATAALTLHHWSDKGQGVAEAYRVLRRGGLLVIGDPLLEGWLGNRFWGWSMQAIDGGRFATEQEMRAYLHEAGFEQAAISLVPNSMKSQYLITALKP